MASALLDAMWRQVTGERGRARGKDEFVDTMLGTPAFVDLRRQGGLFPDNPFGPSNPLQTAALLENTEDVWRFIGSGTARVPLLEGNDQSLRLVMTGGADFFRQRNSLLSPVELEYEAVLAENEAGTSALSNADNLNLNGNANLVHTWAPAAFTATTSVGVQYEDRDLDLNRIFTTGLVAGQGGVDDGPLPFVIENRQRVRDFGIFAQEEFLALDSRLLLTAGLRADRSSNNGDPDEFFFYPKAAASYRFPGLFTYVDELKLRAAYGETGNLPLWADKFTEMSTANSIDGFKGIVVQGVTGAPDIAMFAPGAICCRVQWVANAYGPIFWQLMILQAGDVAEAGGERGACPPATGAAPRHRLRVRNAARRAYGRAPVAAATGRTPSARCDPSGRVADCTSWTSCAATRARAPSSRSMPPASG